MRKPLIASLSLALAAAVLAGCSAKTAGPAPAPAPVPPVAAQPAPQVPATPPSPAPAPATPAPSTPSTPATPAPPTPATPAQSGSAGIAASSLQELVPLKDAGTVRVALSEASPIAYRVIVAGDLGGVSKDQYLDQVVQAHGKLQGGELILVVYARDNYDVRFELGPLFRQRNVTAADILGLVRSVYQPKSRAGDPDGGLAALIRAINQRLA